MHQTVVWLDWQDSFFSRYLQKKIPFTYHEFPDSIWKGFTGNVAPQGILKVEAVPQVSHRHRIHVWYIYQPLPWKSTVHVGKKWKIYHMISTHNLHV